jgi:hypothetical protein
MTAQQNGTPDPAVLEAELAARRVHLAATIDELIERSKPKEIARRSVRETLAKLSGAVRTPTGELRVERVGAIAASVFVVVALIAIARRRRS